MSSFLLRSMFLVDAGFPVFLFLSFPSPCSWWKNGGRSPGSVLTCYSLPFPLFLVEEWRKRSLYSIILFLLLPFRLFLVAGYITFVPSSSSPPGGVEEGAPVLLLFLPLPLPLFLVKERGPCITLFLPLPLPQFLVEEWRKGSLYYLDPPCTSLSVPGGEMEEEALSYL
jgi:hypothetical protein